MNLAAFSRNSYFIQVGAHDRFNVGVGRDFVGHIGLPAGDLLEDGGRLRIFFAGA